MTKPSPGGDKVKDERIEFRAEEGFKERIQAAADRFGVSVGGYIRLAVTKQLELDDATLPLPKQRP